MAIYDQDMLGSLLIDQGVITKAQLDEALEERERTGQPVGHILVEFSFATEEQILSLLAEHLDMDVVDLSKIKIPQELLDKVGSSIARAYGVIPVSEDDTSITVALSDPLNPTVLDDLHFMLETNVRGAICNSKEIEAAIDKLYGDSSESMADLLKSFEEDLPPDLFEEESASEDVITLREIATEAPVVKLLNLILIQAIKDRASDVHFEPFETEFKIRYRVDGVLYEMIPPPRHLAVALTTRIKVISNLNIAERRLPQDGRIQINVMGRNVDIRVSTLPTAFGESVVLRILDRSNVMLDIDQLGMRPEVAESLKQEILKPNGIILVTGPTGSGKTTTLYSFLTALNNLEDKLITTEDPVEYDIEGIIQVPINTKIGLTYGRCLRAILRQDPDKIMVGEIRDIDTAHMAIHSALTGHLVLSTLHTNEACGAITRLIDMGIEPFLITSTLESIVAQRLIRAICSRCKTAFKPSEFVLSQVGLTPEDTEGRELFYGKGCSECNNTGYRGRTGIFEVLFLNDEIRPLVIERAPTSALRQKALSLGMTTLRKEGIVKILEGITTIEEVARETQ